MNNDVTVTSVKPSPENTKVLTGVGFQVLTAGVLARHLLTLTRQGDFRKVLEYLDDLRFSDELKKVEEAVAAGCLEGYFSVQGVDGTFASIKEAVRGWHAAGSPKPGETHIFHHRWLGSDWSPASVGKVGTDPARAAFKKALAS